MMNRLRIGRPRARVTLVAGLTTALAVPAILLAQTLETTFADLKGEVQWSTAGSTQWETASSNTVLHAGDRVRTAANSSARLAFYEGSTTDLVALTGVRIDALQPADTENQIKLSQTAGLIQAQVQDTAAVPVRFEVETPASNVRAPATTCPWVRVGSDGTTLVRNYRTGVRLPVAPQPVQQVVFQPILVPGVAGAPMPIAIPQLITVLKDMPLTQADDQPIIRCPSGSATTGSGTMPSLGADHDAGPLAGLATGRLVLASLGLGHDRARVLTQAAGTDLVVTNTAGTRVAAVTVPPGNETQIMPGQVPAAAGPIGTFAAQSAAQAMSAAAAQQASAAGAQASAAMSAAAAAGAQSAQAAAAGASFAQALAAQQLLSGLSQPPPAQTVVRPESSPTASPTRIVLTLLPTQSGTPTPTPTPTLTLTPTRTATPTLTLTPTSTPTLSLTILPGGAAFR
jgi:hypothetical protein